MESLGCELAVLMIEPETGTINQHGSNKGVQFLLQNETVALKFMDFFGKANVNYRVGVVEKKKGVSFLIKEDFTLLKQMLIHRHVHTVICLIKTLFHVTSNIKTCSVLDLNIQFRLGHYYSTCTLGCSISPPQGKFLLCRVGGGGGGEEEKCIMMSKEEGKHIDVSLSKVIN